jgi:localization factor PodJL
MTAQPDLPWNVAGIEPEAREAARASARREGLSVGEWLTRRILNDIAEMEPAPNEWWLQEPAISPAAETMRRGARETIDPFANLRPVDDSNENRHGKVYEPINGTLGEIAAQVRLAACERTDGFDRLSARVAQLDKRLVAIEGKTAGENVRDKEMLNALHAKIAGLADQISEIAARGVAQNTDLAKTIEAVVEKLAQSRGDADAQHKTMDERVGTIADEIESISARLDDARARLDDARDGGERQIHAVEERVAAVERALDTIAGEATETARLGGSLDRLTQRMESTETEYLNNIERVETRLGRIEANSGEMILDRRLTGIEQTLAEMASLIGKDTRENSGGSEARSFEPRNRPGEDGLRDEAPVPPIGTPILDLPPFPQNAETILATTPDEGVQPAPAPDHRTSRKGFGKASRDAAPPAIAGQVDPSAAAPRTAPAADPAQPSGTPFSGVDPSEHQENENGNTRLVLLGGLGLIVLAALAIGLYLSNGSSRRASIPHPAVAQSAKATPITARRTVQPQTVSAARPTTSSAKPLTPQQRLAALANAGNAKAQELLGLEYVDGDGISVNEAQGAKWLERAAARGEAVAAYRLGTLYERGHGVVADHANATRWYAAAAKAGNRKAMHNLAVAYAQGTGVRKDPLLAAQWFLRAANLGLADSQFDLGVLYERGLGLPQSLKEAYKWYAIAAAQGDAESRTRMQAIASHLRAGDKRAAGRAAANFHPAPLGAAANIPPIAASLIGG